MRRTPALILLSALALAGCGSSSSGSPAAAPAATSAAPSPSAALPTLSSASTAPVVITVGDGDGKDARSASLSVRQLVYIDLYTCGGCGYSWTVEQPPAAAVATRVQVAQPTPAAQPSGPPVVGNPTTTRFAFRAVKSGTTTVSLGYHGPGRAMADRVVVVKITVKS